MLSTSVQMFQLSVRMGQIWGCIVQLMIFNLFTFPNFNSFKYQLLIWTRRYHLIQYFIVNKIFIELQD